MPLDHADRHAGRLSGRRRRGARPERGDRAQPVRDVARCACRSSACVIGEGGSGGALAIGVCDRLLMLQYCDLLGDLARRLRVHPVEERRQEGARGRGDGHHGRAAATARAGRRGAARAARRRAPRPAGHGRTAEGGAAAPPRRARRSCRPDSCWRQRVERLAATACSPAAGRRDRARRCDARVLHARAAVGRARARALADADGPRAVRALRRVQRRARFHGAAAPRWSRLRGAAARRCAARHPRRSRPARRSARWSRMLPRRLRGARRRRSCRRGVDARPARGESPEAAARAARYAALAARCAPGEVLLTAHHADDQLETVLLQLLRGGGLRAWPACRRRRVRRRLAARPLLGFTRDELRAWRARGACAGSRIPATSIRASTAITCASRCCRRCAQRWPAAARDRGTQSPRHARRGAAQLEAAVARATSRAPPTGRRCRSRALRRWPPPRQRAVLRAWLRGAGPAAADERARWRRCVRDMASRPRRRIPASTGRARGCVATAAALYAEPAALGADAAGRRSWRPARQRDLGAGPAARSHCVPRTRRRPEPRARCPRRSSVRARDGGERFVPAGAAHTPPLRKLAAGARRAAVAPRAAAAAVPRADRAALPSAIAGASSRRERGEPVAARRLARPPAARPARRRKSTLDFDSRPEARARFLWPAGGIPLDCSPVVLSCDGDSQ